MDILERVLVELGIRKTQGSFLHLLVRLWLVIAGLSRGKILRMALQSK
jgi:hypothetical protein